MTTAARRWPAVRAAAAVGLAFSALAILAGTRVLTGRDVPDYPVLTWLVRYNVAAGIAGVVVALGAWQARSWARAAAWVVTALHGGVLLTLIATRLTGGVVATDSLVAMSLRTVVWLAIAFTASRALAARRRASLEA